MVFEVLGDNLLALIKEYNYRGIPPSLVRRIARQVLVALHYLHTTCAIIHTDLKPENIMLTQALRPRKRPPQPLEDGAALTPPPNGHADPAATSSAHTSTPSGLTKNQKKKWKRKQKKSAAKGPLQQVLDSHASGASPSHDSCSTSMDMNGEEDSAEVNHREAESAMSPERRGARQDAGALGEQEMSGLSDFRLDDEQAEPCLLDHPESIHCKVADFGNACWVHKQFTTDIQTRQYRCPEVILGANYSTPADMWSLACMIFELVTGDHLFDPRSGRDYGRDEDHLALFIELLGPVPLQVALRGEASHEFFNRHGQLRAIHKLRPWGLCEVLREKYDFSRQEAELLSSFLLPMLDYRPERRATAQQMLSHDWLDERHNEREGRHSPSDHHHHHHDNGQSPGEKAARRHGDYEGSGSRSPAQHDGHRSRSPSPSPPPVGARAEANGGPAEANGMPEHLPRLSSEASTGTPLQGGRSSPRLSSMASSGVLLSPMAGILCGVNKPAVYGRHVRRACSAESSREESVNPVQLTSDRRSALGATLLVGVGSILAASEAQALGFQKDLKKNRRGKEIPESEFKDGPQGLKYYDVSVGTGPEVKKGDRIAVHYDAKWKNITFMTSRQGMGVTGGEPVGFDVGAQGAGGTLPGLDLGVRGMRSGGQRKLIIPPELAYGSKGVAEIPPNATLNFDVQLLSIKQNAFGYRTKIVEG
ncbi:hypothetical protein WJX73_009418 [Symbiochloris irregularis]|uniref:peptidylprolyl isomerase n=1 Tax=Symbiochloris irregularis TaxID=706552 RepID=A0AAW1PCA3_9CHLO